MFNSYAKFNHTPWESEEDKRRQSLYDGQPQSNGLGAAYYSQQIQTPYPVKQPQLTPRQMVEQTWDRSAAEQTAKEKELELMRNMSTHDALEFAWNKQEEKKICLRFLIYATIEKILWEQLVKTSYKTH